MKRQRQLIRNILDVVNTPQTTSIEATVLHAQGEYARVKLADGSILPRVKIAGGTASNGGTGRVEFADGADPVLYAAGGSSGTGGFTVVAGGTSGSVVGSGYVPETRQIIAGDGLQGGGALTVDRTLAVNSSVARNSWLVNAGFGLTGGGALSATGITFDVDQAETFTWAGTHTFNNTAIFAGVNTRVTGSVVETQLGFANVRFGLLVGTPRIVLEEPSASVANSRVWEIDNSGGV